MSTILIVEDNLSFRESLNEALSSQFPATRIMEASNAVEALRAVSVAPPDLMFVDIRLPGETGLEVTRKVKQDHPEIQVVVITNYDLAEYREAARRYGADHFVHKGSASWSEITALVKSLLSKAGPEKEAPSEQG
jgi:DNA-binding NarL/FixJ family response regulator